MDMHIIVMERAQNQDDMRRLACSTGGAGATRVGAASSGFSRTKDEVGRQTTTLPAVLPPQLAM